MTLLAQTPVPVLEPAGTAIVEPVRPSWFARLITRFGGVAVRLLVVAVALFWLFPTLGLAVASLRSSADNSASGWWNVFAAPSQLTLHNYAALLQNERIVGSLWNTVLITVPSTLLVVVLGALGAYALAWIEFPGRDVIFVVVVALIVVPVQVAIIPDASIFKQLGIYGEIPAVVAFHVAFGLPFAIFLLRNFFISIPRDLLEAARVDGAREFAIFRQVVLPIAWPAVAFGLPFAIFLLRNFFISIPRDLLEAARVDGAREFGIFRQVVLPIAWPAIASLTIFQFLWVWNDLLVALVFGFDNPPITYTLKEQMRAFSSNIDVIGPGSFLSVLVPLIVFFAFQRYFLQSVLAGSVK